MTFLALLVVGVSCKVISDKSAGLKNRQRIKALVVTGGHDFERAPFFAMFDSFDKVEYIEAEQKDDSEIFEDISDWDYDVIVLYNMTQKISPKRQANFIELLDKGVGLVVVHHSIANFQDWPEYRNIIGAKYYLKETTEDGVTYPRSQYQHDVDINVYVTDPTHSVIRGLRDFSVNDETYSKWTFDSGNHLLLTTDHPASNRQLAWVRNYRNARVCCIQLGHGAGAYTNGNYRRLVAQAIEWCAHKVN